MWELFQPVVCQVEEGSEIARQPVMSLDVGSDPLVPGVPYPVGSCPTPGESSPAPRIIEEVHGTYKDLLAGKLEDTDGVWLPPRHA